MQTLTAAVIVAFLAGTHADHIDGTDSDLIGSAQGICIDMDDYGHNAQRSLNISMSTRRWTWRHLRSSSSIR